MSPAKKFAAGAGLGARAGGFTLLEVMLAFVLLATTMGLVIAMLSNGLRQVQQAQNATEASLYAQSLLDGLGVLEPIEPTAQDGEFDGGRYRYHLEIAEAVDPAPRLELPSRVEPRQAIDAPTLYRIGLSVRWGAGQPAQRVDFALLRARASDAQTGAMP